MDLGSFKGFYMLDRHLGIKCLLQVNHLAYAQSWTLFYSIYICIHHSIIIHRLPRMLHSMLVHMLKMTCRLLIIGVVPP